MNLDKKIELYWNKHYETTWQEKVVSQNGLTTKVFNNGITIVHNVLRDSWELNKNKTIGCQLDDEADLQEFRYRTIFVRININPTLKYHLFAKVPEHRSYPVTDDHLTVLTFVNETDYAKKVLISKNK